MRKLNRAVHDIFIFQYLHKDKEDREVFFRGFGALLPTSTFRLYNFWVTRWWERESVLIILDSLISEAQSQGSFLRFSKHYSDGHRDTVSKKSLKALFWTTSSLCLLLLFIRPKIWDSNIHNSIPSAWTDRLSKAFAGVNLTSSSKGRDDLHNLFGSIDYIFHVVSTKEFRIQLNSHEPYRVRGFDNWTIRVNIRCLI